jgi:molybdate transport system substrate-binding protein
VSRARTVAAALAVGALLLAGCGDDEEDDDAQGSSGRLVVSAASSLKKAFTAYGDDFGDAGVRLSFAGSDELAAQIRQGVEPDVYAAANTTLPDQLYDEGLVEEPAVFAANRLVIAVPAGGARVRSIDDLAKPGVRLAVGAESVPVGSYTREVLSRLGEDTSEAILDNVRSNEPDVVGVAGKVSQSAVDAGFVYVTDVEASGGRLEAIDLPERLQPSVGYAAAVVKGARNREGAERFVDGLLSGAGERALRDAGFEPPPR